MPTQSLPQVESYFYDIRKQLFDYDQVLNTQVRAVGAACLPLLAPAWAVADVAGQVCYACHACRAMRTSRVQGPDCGSLPLLVPQRDKVYAERRRALEASDLTPLMAEYAERTIDDILEVRPAV